MYRLVNHDSRCQILGEAKNTSCVRHLCRNLYLMDLKVIMSEHVKIAFIDSFLSEGDNPPPMALAATSSIATADLITWHQHLSHLNTDAISLMQAKNIITRMEITQGTTLITPCKLCLKAKQTHAEIHETTGTWANVILSHIFSDVCSCMNKSHKNYEYFVT